MSNKNIFEALRQWRLIQTVEYHGIGEAAKDEPKSEVNEIVLKAIHDHQDIIKSHQDSIASLQKCMEDEEKKDHPTMEPKSSCGSSSSSSQGGGDVLCYICGKNGHKAKDCCGIGCYKCGKLGHIGGYGLRCDGGWDYKREGLIGSCGAICYYCGKAGYIPVCSMCGETGHVGKECW